MTPDEFHEALVATQPHCPSASTKPPNDGNPDLYKKVWRAANLALGCIANIAGYRAGWIEDKAGKRLASKDDFWIRVNGNFLDHAALDWCILFMDRSRIDGEYLYGRHHWKALLPEAEWHAFLLCLNQAMGMCSKDRDKAFLKIKRYRDKALAHLDDQTQNTFYPQTEHILSSAGTLYDWLVRDGGLLGYHVNAPKNASEFYEQRLADARGQLRFAHGASVRYLPNWKGPALQNT